MIDGQPVTKAMLDGLSAEFEQDWPESEVKVTPTSHGKALAVSFRQIIAECDKPYVSECVDWGKSEGDEI
jgi:hypothetical protein